MDLENQLIKLNNPCKMNKQENKNEFKIPPPPSLQSVNSGITTNIISENKEESKTEQRRSMDIQGDLKSALKNKFKNVKTGDDSD